MQRLEHHTLNDQAYEALKQGLITGRFVPGEVLTIRRLAVECGISATPIREALQRLTAERVLELLPNRSIVVPILTADKFLDLRRIRCVIEGFAGELATPRLSDADILRLARFVEQMEQDIAEKNSVAYLRRNQKFHSFIYERAQSNVALRVIQDLWTQVGPFLNQLFEDSGYLERANEGHRMILAAIKRRNAGEVRDSIAWDISEAASSLIRRL